jgi:hypothetical protein
VEQPKVINSNFDFIKEKEQAKVKVIQQKKEEIPLEQLEIIDAGELAAEC